MRYELECSSRRPRRDDGVGFAPRYREGAGLGNLRRRLATLYGERAGPVIQDLGVKFGRTVPAGPERSFPGPPHVGLEGGGGPLRPAPRHEPASSPPARFQTPPRKMLDWP